MSSPAGVPMGNPHIQSRPPQVPLAPNPNNNDSSENGMMVRPMRLKVLYTFDDECKTNCLARWPQVLQIQSIAMDETTSIGVIGLRTCLQAIIECSPEILPRPGRDFTVYAYDYSEDDNPLVGQGMLSRALATPPPMPNTPTHQSQKLITGRVCKNIMGLFANGVKETLEVKLRLVPQTVSSMEYTNTMGNSNQQRISTPVYERNEWNSLMQSQPNLPQMSNRTTTPNSMSNNKGTTMEVVNQLLSPSLPPINPYKQALPPAPAAVREEPVAIAPRDQKILSPSSRTTVKRGRRGRPPKNTRSETGGNTSGYEEGTEGEDNPAPKKRAKITRADWNSKGAFGSGSDSLRVTASTAGSIRAFRPLAPSGGVAASSHLQEIPRAPTPVPIAPQPVSQQPANQQPPNQHQNNQPPSHQHRPQSQSGLRQGSIPQLEMPQAHSPAYSQRETSLPPEDCLRLSIESAHPSPERIASPGFTPQDIASSPPILRNITPSIRSSPPCLSSPSLPPMPRFDSGSMNGNLEDLDDLFGEDDEISRPVDDEDIVVAKKTIKRRGPRKIQPANSNPDGGFHIQEETPGPMELLPKRMLISEQPKPKPKGAQTKSRRNSIMSEDGQTLPPLRQDTRTNSRPPSQSQHGTNAEVPPPSLHLPTPPTSEFTLLPMPQMQVPVVPLPPQARQATGNPSRTASTGSMALPNIPASDSTLPPSFQRSQTWSEHPHYMTEAPNVPSQTEAKKAAIKQKLETALRNGQMPQYCENCGAIETPTWRRAWSQECQGAPGYHEYSEEPGRVTAINITTRDEAGVPTSYLLIKKALGAGEDQKQFKAFNLCNPCGIWMSKYKSQRPEAKWGKDPDSKKKRPTKAKAPAVIATSEANFPPSEKHFSPSEAFRQHPPAAPPGTDRFSPIDLDGVESTSQIAPLHHNQNGVRRASSVRPAKKISAMTSDSASAALRRALQSSPARWSQRHNAEIEDEPEVDTTRRLLFSSPRKDSTVKVLGEITTNVVQVMVDIHSTKDVVTGSIGKENCSAASVLDDDAELMRLIEDQFARPTTPVQKILVPNPFKTPTRATPNHRPITRSVTRSERSGKSPSHLLAPPKTPSRTPRSSRRSPRDNAIFESPFTAQLNQLMSDNPINSPSQHLDFSNLPDLPSFGNGSYNLQQYDEDFFSTDVPMPSSPPRMSYPFPNTSAGVTIDWDNFGFGSAPIQNDKKSEQKNERAKNLEFKEELADEEPAEEALTNETA